MLETDLLTSSFQFALEAGLVTSSFLLAVSLHSTEELGCSSETVAISCWQCPNIASGENKQIKNDYCAPNDAGHSPAKSQSSGKVPLSRFYLCVLQSFPNLQVFPCSLRKSPAERVNTVHSGRSWVYGQNLSKCVHRTCASVSKAAASIRNMLVLLLVCLGAACDEVAEVGKFWWIVLPA